MIDDSDTETTKKCLKFTMLFVEDWKSEDENWYITNPTRSYQKCDFQIDVSISKWPRRQYFKTSTNPVEIS